MKSKTKKTVLEEQLEKEAAEEAAQAEAEAAEAEPAAETAVEDEKPEAAPAAEAEPAAEEPLRDQFIRLQADFDNFRKRMQRERAELYTRANEDIINELLSVLDHFEMGLETAEKHETEAGVINGFRMVYDQMLKALTKFGLQQLDAMDNEFDPHNHEAISHLPSADVEENHVMAQVRRGYKLGEKLLRPAQVVVSSGKSE